MALFGRAIVATDFSPASATMLKCLGGLKAYGVERLLMLLCMPSEGAFALDYATIFAEEILARQKKVLEAQELDDAADVRIDVPYGHLGPG